MGNYTIEKNVLILLSLMKKHGIRKFVVSPGTTNMPLVGSLQNDSYFEVYSCVDERSAAYMACGLAEESGEPVALSCTGATASRNYMSALTEAYYRNIPILSITSMQDTSRVGHNVAQVIDRSVMPKDTVGYSIELPTVNNSDDEWRCTTSANIALLELDRNGGTPVHINLVTSYSMDFSVRELPETRVIRRYGLCDELPSISQNKVGIFIGAHSKISKTLNCSIEEFCEKYNGVVLCDHTSNYKGKYRINGGFITNIGIEVGLLIDIGNVSGAYVDLRAKEIWRVNIDGKVRDTYKKLTNVFQMDELSFFKTYNNRQETRAQTAHYQEWKGAYDIICSKIPELPFSNLWIAQNTAPKLPKGSVLHLGILNSLRSWNFFNIDTSIQAYSNTGGFGIDGIMSSLIGASLHNTNRLYFAVLGDLAFFYDMNSIGNRHIGNNVRILLINNGKGTEFRNYNHNAAVLGEAADEFVAAAGHYGNKSKNLVKNYAEALGFEYIMSTSKDQFISNVEYFTQEKKLAKPIIFEIFTNSDEESNALKMMNSITYDNKSTVKKIAKNILGKKGINTIKKVINK